MSSPNEPIKEQKEWLESAEETANGCFESDAPTSPTKRVAFANVAPPARTSAAEARAIQDHRRKIWRHTDWGGTFKGRFSSVTHIGEGSLSVRLGESRAQELFAHADKNEDGTIDKAEFTKLHELIVSEAREEATKVAEAKAEAKEERRLKGQATKIALATCCLLVCMIGGNAALTAAVVFLAKDTKVSATGQLINVATGEAVKTATATVPQALDSRLPDAVWAEIEYLDIKNANGGFLHLVVQATSRVVSEEALFDSYIHVHTAVGTVILDGDIMTFQDGMEGVFKSAGFEVVGGGSRRLSGAFELIGLFNSIPSFESWDSKYDLPPRIPTTFVATGSMMYGCAIDRFTNLCDTHKVPTANRTTIDGSEYVSAARLAISADAAKGKMKERFTDMVALHGWALERVHDLTRRTIEQAQTWETTREAFFCMTTAVQDSQVFGPFGADTSKFAARYEGEVSLLNETFDRFRIKHREVEHLTAEYYMINQGQAADGQSIVAQPRRIKVSYPSNANCKASMALCGSRSLMFDFDSFSTVDAVDDEVFDWSATLDGPKADGLLFNQSVCASTINYTSSPAPRHRPAIPPQMQIFGTNPFQAMTHHPMSQSFFWDLQIEPSLTAARWTKDYRHLVPYSFPPPCEGPCNVTEHEESYKASVFDQYYRREAARAAWAEHVTGGAEQVNARQLRTREAGHNVVHVPTVNVETHSSLQSFVDAMSTDLPVGAGNASHGRSMAANGGDCLPRGRTPGYCPDMCAANFPFFTTPIPNFACERSISLPNGCFQSFSCDVAIPLHAAVPTPIPSVDLSFGGTLFHDCGTPDANGDFKCRSGGCMNGRLVIGLFEGYPDWLPQLEIYLEICLSGGRLQCQEQTTLREQCSTRRHCYLAPRRLEEVESDAEAGGLALPRVDGSNGTASNQRELFGWLWPREVCENVVDCSWSPEGHFVSKGVNEVIVETTAGVMLFVVGVEATLHTFMYGGDQQYYTETRHHHNGHVSHHVVPSCLAPERGDTRESNFGGNEYNVALSGRVYLCMIWCWDIANGFILPWGG